MLKDKYISNNIVIESNFGEKWDVLADKEDEFIMMGDNNSDQCVAFNLEQAKFIRDSLDDIITFFESIPNVGNKVLVVNGMFKGYYGTIVDIDTCDSKKPLVIKLNDTPSFNNCTCFVNFDDVNKA